LAVWNRSHALAIHNLKTKPMTDLIYVAVLALFFVVGQIYAHWCEKLWKFMENIIVGLIALALFAYLFIAMVYPEKF
jgi:K+-transporting ATPase KdpF subunit